MFYFQKQYKRIVLKNITFVCYLYFLHDFEIITCYEILQNKFILIILNIFI